MRALVTGASGLIGANVVRALLDAGHEVRAFVRETSDLASLAGLDVELARGDVLDPGSLLAAARGCEVLFHSAAVFAYWRQTREQLEAVAVQGTVHAIEAAREASVHRMVLTSSSVVLGSSPSPEPRDERADLNEPDPPPYVLAKAAQERVAFHRASEVGLDLVVVCPTMSVGPYGHHLGPSNAIVTTYLGDPFRLTFPGGCNIVSVEDVAQGHVLAALRGRPGARYVLGGENLEWAAIHRTLSELCGISGPYWVANHTAALLAATASELVGWWTGAAPVVTRAQAKMVGRYYWYRHDRAAALGFSPRPARQALAEAVAWLVTTAHIARAQRQELTLSREVYAARAAVARRERARLRLGPR